MTQLGIQYKRSFALVPTARGVGFAVLEGADTLVDWGFKALKSADREAGALKMTKEMITKYGSTMLVLEELCFNPSRRSERTLSLDTALSEQASGSGVSVVKISAKDVRSFFSSEGTKQALARSLVKLFPRELDHLLPEKRQTWQSEDYRMAIFEAVGLVVVCAFKTQYDRIGNAVIPEQNPPPRVGPDRG